MISKQARGRAWYSEHIVGANLIVKLTRFPLIAVTAAAAAGRVLSLSLFSSSTNCYMGSTSKISNNRCCVNSKLPLAARPTRHSALAAAATTLTLTIQLQNDFMVPIINDYGKSPLGMHGQASGGASGGGGAAAAPR